MTTEAAWLSRNYSTLSHHKGRDLRGSWIAVIGEKIVDSDKDPKALVERVNREHGEGRALFASVVAKRLG